jgi:hypothetical protein
MALSHSPSIVTNGLVLCLDAANLKSFKGVNATNILNSIAYNQSNQSSAAYRVTNGEESVYIPSLGIVTSKYVDFYNDYGGSGVCCPNLYSYGTGLSVSPNTTYTYSIIYKTTTGYSHPNYMYRYEYASNGAYAGEAGVHSTSNRTSLGDGWWFAWGQFTTSATTATLNTYLFHYEYGTQNRVYVYRAALYQGTYIIPPEHILTPGQVRGTTVATGGGWADLSGTSNHGQLVNGTSYNSSNGGSLVFDGTDDVVLNGVGNNYPYPYHTLDVWVKSPGLSPTMNGGGGLIAFDYGRILMINYQGGISYYMHDGNNYLFISSITENLIFNNTWHNVVALRGMSTYQVYVDGVLKDSGSNGGNLGWNGLNGWSAMASVIGDNPNDVRYKLLGNIASVKMYNRALTAAEVQQNFNALRGRYGI